MKCLVAGCLCAVYINNSLALSSFLAALILLTLGTPTSSDKLATNVQPMHPLEWLRLGIFLHARLTYFSEIQAKSFGDYLIVGIHSDGEHDKCCATVHIEIFLLLLDFVL